MKNDNDVDVRLADLKFSRDKKPILEEAEQDVRQFRNDINKGDVIFSDHTIEIAERFLNGLPY